MESLRNEWLTTGLPESSITLIGLLLALSGLVLSAGIFVGLGIGLLIAGTGCATADGPELVRYALAFVSLVGAQLLAFGGVTQWLGGIMIGSVVIAIAYGRLNGVVSAGRS